MPLSTVSLHRPLTSYAKVRAWIGSLLRNRRFQLRRPRVLAAKYLDIGCGPNTHADFINLDSLWHPGIDVCWDIRRGLPFADGSLQGVFSEHCLEHFSLRSALEILREVRRVLVPGGIVRIIVPDGELYLRTYASQVAGDSSRSFPFQDAEQAGALWTPMVSVNRLFYQDRDSPSGHRTIYDFALLSALLRRCGFAGIQRRTFGQGSDPRLLIDSPDRSCESLYVEAAVPAP